MKLRLTLAIAAASAAAASAVIGAAAGPAAAAPISSCSSTSGTIVVVDFAHWSGPLVGACDLNSPSTGYRLLGDEGFTTSGDRTDGPGLVCRIGNSSFGGGRQYPTAATEACNRTPPVAASWSYWIAASGSNTFSYSSVGVMTDHPKPGAVELWIFGNADDSPTCSPNAIRSGSSGHCSPVGPPISTPSHSTAPATSHHAPAPTTHAPTTTAGHTGTPTVAHPTATGTRSAPATGAAVASGSAARSTTAAGSGTTAGNPSTTDSTDPPIVAASPAAGHHSAGSAAPVITTVAILAVLLAGAGYVRRRRARLSEE